jgi:ethanolamine kinase
MIYRYIPGRVCSPADLRKMSVWKGVATRLGQWHATLPVIPTAQVDVVEKDLDITLPMVNIRPNLSPEEINAITPGKVTPNVWTIMQKWIYALPTKTESEKARQAQLQEELERTVKELADLPGLGENGLVLGHCDLLSGNVILMPPAREASPGAENVENVTFIDYEYASPAPAAFDLANHFAEWGGFDCDYNVLPTRKTRRAFLSQYLESYKNHISDKGPREAFNVKTELDKLCDMVDRFRGIPGLYWGIWALIQATISQIDFDYAAYAEIRLGEYFAWRQVEEQKGKEMPLRERRWAESI